MAQKRGRNLIAFLQTKRTLAAWTPTPSLSSSASSASSTDRLVDVRSPWDDALVGQCCEAGNAEVRHALAVAGAAFHQARRQPLHERAAMLRRAASLIREHRDDLAERIVAEAGKPITLAEAEAERCALTFEFRRGGMPDVGRRREHPDRRQRGGRGARGVLSTLSARRDPRHHAL